MEPCSVFFNLESDYLEIKREVNKDLNELSIKVQDNDLKNKINMLLHEAQRTVRNSLYIVLRNVKRQRFNS